MFELLKKLTGDKKEVPSMTSSKYIERLFEESYNARIKEIESLRKYDRGEKNIHARDINTIVRSLQ